MQYLGYVDEETKAALYSRTSCLVLPSVYEGFGMPIVEAKSYGAPVAASNIDVFKEIAGNSIAYFDPKSSASICETIEDVLNLKLPQEVALPALKNSWEEIAQDVYEQIKASL